jgi:ADP-ribose pyrophosphatase YjhB (NUDIX family)
MQPGSLPRKLVVVGALIRTPHDEVLIVKRNYAEGWALPGGVVELDESPREACRREVKEELGLDVPIGALLSIDYRHGEATKPEALVLLFDGGRISDSQARSIDLQTEEISALLLAKPEDLGNYTTPETAARVLHVLSGSGDPYLETGVGARHLRSFCDEVDIGDRSAD